MFSEPDSTIDACKMRTKFLRGAVVLQYCPQKDRAAMADYVDGIGRDEFIEFIRKVNSHPIVKSHKRLLTAIGESIKTNVTDDAPLIALNGKLKVETKFSVVQADGTLHHEKTRTPPWRQCLRREMVRLIQKPEPVKTTQVLTHEFYCDLLKTCRIGPKDDLSEANNTHDVSAVNAISRFRANTEAP